MAQQNQAPWPMYQHDAQHTGRSSHIGPNQPELKWTFDTGSGRELIGPPVIGADGTIYLSSNDDHLYAVNPDGTLKWLAPVKLGFDSSPAIDMDGTIYVGNSDTNLRGLNAIYPDGTFKWLSLTDASVLDPATIGADGTIYATTPLSLYAFNSNGNPKWKYTIGTGDSDIILTTPTIGPDGTIYVGHQFKHFYAINANGTLKWTFTIESEFHGFKSTPAVGADGTVYAGSDYGRLYAIAPGGSLKWEFSTFGNSGIFTTPAVGLDGVVYLGHYNGRIYALYPSGTLKWEYSSGNSGDSFSSAVIDGNGIIYVTSDVDNSLYAFYPNSALKWKFQLDSDIISKHSPVIGFDQTIYINSNDGKLYAIGAPFQKKVRIVDFTAPYLNRNLDTAMADGTVYWYFQLLEEDGTPATFSTVDLELSMPGRRIFPEIELFSESVLRLGIDVNSTGVSEGQTAVIEFPEIIEMDGQSVTLSEKPAPLSLTRQRRERDRSWDIFAGKSAGISGSVGSIAAGPSVAIAKLSVKGEGGIGLNISVDENGIFELSRRFESGVAVQANVPAVNLVIGEVDVGTKAKVIAKDQLGQTVRFDSDNNSDEVKLAKSGYILETASLGGVDLSPLAGIVVQAIITTLNNLAGVDETFDLYLYENFVGLGLEGEIGAEIGARMGDNSPLEFTFVEAVRRIAMQVKLVRGLRTPTYLKIEPEVGIDFELDLIRASLGFDDKVELEINNPTLLALGSSMYFAPVMTFDSNKKPIEARLKFEAGRELDTIYGTVANKTFVTEIIIPEHVLENLIGQGSNLDKISRGYDETGPRVNIDIGPDAIVDDIVKVINLASHYYSQGGDPVFIETKEKYGNGYDFELEISLEGALGAGVGISLGVEMKYYSNLEYLRKRAVLLDGLKAYLVESYPDDWRLTDFVGLKATLEDLLSGTVPLIETALKNLVDIIKMKIEPLQNFVVEVHGSSAEVLAKVFGSLQEAGEFAVTSLNPASDRVIYKAFHKPEVQKIYMSHKIAHRQADGTLQQPQDEATLILVSDNFVLNFYPEAGGVADTFDTPVNFAITVQESYLQKNGFGAGDKDKVRMYAYDDSAHTWVRLDQEANASPDTVTAAVAKPGSYALGIEISPDRDFEPPVISDISPQTGSTVPARPLLQAKITDQLNGSGVSVADSRLLLDGQELDASWNPLDNILFYRVEEDLSDGPHTFAITALDFNGNAASASIAFSVDRTTKVEDEDTPPGNFKIYPNYPNPFNTSTRIKYDLPAAGKVEVNIYDVKGYFVKSLVDAQQSAGEHEGVWDGTNAEGKSVSSGIYFYQVKFGEFNVVKRMTLVK